MIEQALRDILRNHAGLTALVGDRIYPVMIPQGADLPAVTIHRITGPREHSQSGPSGLANPRFQVSCWSTTYSGDGGAKYVAAEVRSALNGYRGTVSGVRIDSCLLVDEVDLVDGQPPMVYHVALDFELWHAE